ncbi:hypothetical protein GLAREA_08925 [Glarea lozoyensis ATCC 20868]|uniref:Uncharacterized protein n=1 Tax=Glarea lozoyensis (strain ATCC 20868 / MF5171) TaxID=1116229 RepID=S3DEC6_GLAL2|nr:uncharacterized protein GLAREA_08925 [Glarea lozoyensis ATCC 20868]EPE36762.1 hypothetical protein GLAREA_08925 [Glarea lozoyensis ATCC 20868]
MSRTIARRSDIAPLQSKLPTPLRFPLLVVLSLSLSSFLYSLAAPVIEGDLASVSRRLEGWGEVLGLAGWKAGELGLGWWGGFDGYDLAALSLLGKGPSLYLLGTFYNIRAATVVTSLLIDALATYIPFRLLRPLSRAHAASTAPDSTIVPNKDIVTDSSIQILTTLLASSIYSLTLFSAYATYLPVYFVTYFNKIYSIEAAHSATLVSLFPITLLLGVAAKSFIFTPAAAAAPSLLEARDTVFNPATATLTETFWYNVWSFSPRTRTVIQRTATLALVSGVNTFVQTYVTIEGVEAVGALAYAGVWAVAAVVTGASLGAVGAV